MQDFNSLLEVFDWFKKQGFADEFHPKKQGLWHSKSQKLYPVKKINVIHSIKLEEDSDPDYTTFVFAIEVEEVNLRGYFVDATGIYAALDYSDLKKKK